MKLPENARWPHKPPQVVGSNVRRLRKEADVNLQDFAKEAKRQGLKWAPGRVSDLEGGRVDLNLATLVSVAQVLANLSGRPVALADLLATEGKFDVNGRTLTGLDALFRGEPVQPAEEKKATPTELAKRNSYDSLADAADKLGVPKAKVGPVLLAYEDAGLVDRRAATALGLKVKELCAHSVLLWGRGFAAQRDHVAGAGANVAELAQANRDLRAELQERLNNS